MKNSEEETTDPADLVDSLKEDWHRERPELDLAAMGIVGRLVMLGEILKKRANEVLTPYGLGYTDLDTLATLRRSGPPYELRPSVLLKTVLIQSGSLTACLKRLEKNGLVERVLIPEDHRGRAVRLTERGRELIDRAIEARFDDAEASVASLDAGERRTLEELLRRVLLANREP
ncbi:MAG: MarR family transcriptional regulator [Acidobacteriota bacterium]